jgi:pimeloyl-ACP methyl ester carboxylesterase
MSRTQPRTQREAHLVRVLGRDVRLLVTGDGDGDPILLLNGLTRPLESWAAFTENLSGRTVISFDTPGVGGSPTPLAPMSIPMLAALAAALLDELGLRSADVLGFSHGGGVAQQLAADSPQHVRRLVLAATSCGVGATPGSQPTLRSLRPPEGSADWPRTDSVGTLWNAMAIAGWSSIPFLSAIAAPTLVVCGDRDRVVPLVNRKVLARRISGAQLLLLPAGHDLQRPGPARLLADAVVPFLAVAPLPHAAVG